jgi:L-ascorbate metabolism protein UlaG (beta-lactamase superfamily)
MDITWLGHSCFRVKSKEATLITDPYYEDIAYPWASPTANIVTISHPHSGHGNAAGVGGDPKAVTRPGEYEIKGVFILGLGNFHDPDEGSSRGRNTSYLVEMEDMKLCHLGDLGHVPSARQVQELSELDVLIIPVGGVSTIDGKMAAEIVRLLNPRIVIPMHYGTKVVNWLEPLDKFTTQMGLREIVPQPKLSVTKASMPPETRVVVFDLSAR